ncbi:hypothetical protein [Chryseobacterium sp.]|uniref:hypothetical protein n=1 Tax=Chryseobacterium sp. TaxID=1871047 RepID=UPI0026393A83|nr:hypothetical protein [Chryseobacterium sp.]
MKKIMITGFLCAYAFVCSQIGINTSAPNATLDVASTPAATTKPDGFLAPRITGSALKAKDTLYGTNQTGAIVYVTEGLAVTETSPKTLAVVNRGYFYFNGSVWVKFIDVVRAPAVVTAFNASGNPDATIFPATPETTLSFPVVNINADSSIGTWDSAHSRFTVSKRGVFLMSAALTMENMTDFAGSGLSIHGGSQVASAGSPGQTSQNLSVTGTMILDPGEVIWVGAYRNPAALGGFTAGVRSFNIIFSAIQ